MCIRDRYNTKQLERSEDTTPEIAIISRGSGSVTMAGLVNNERGSLLIEWTEENGVGTVSYTHLDVYKRQ